MGCQNSYKEAEIENELSAQSCISQKSIGGYDKKKSKIPVSPGARVIKRIFSEIPNTKINFFTEASVTQKLFEISIRNFII